ncbi:unnamed protein product [Rotaria socialis]|uniref:Uncharacterized protein n=1 Tax=Rotaria socialis TaxID=392032 RepID=A0A821BVL2_9BILA|nr:unnamed protein product [Rotaria socialis]CAF3411957.1 unnamed protein product [Rotaria socialis]CAF4504563.1 unnamed protein product [Rotaria socialis]CAF4593295.1 unnamed protein product [Rotaria socialis]
MNSSVPDLTTIILNLLNQHTILSSSHDECKTEEKTTTTTAKTDQDNNRQYYFIVFNNPRWSKIIQKRNLQMQQQQQQEKKNKTDPSPSVSVKAPVQDISIDDQFIIDLRKLMNDYVQRTTRPFPMKYFIDLTTDQ